MPKKSKKRVSSRAAIATAVAFGAVFTMAACSDDDLSPGGTPYFMSSAQGEDLPLIDSLQRTGEGEEGYTIYKVSSGTMRLMAADRFNILIGLDTGSALNNLKRVPTSLTGTYLVNEENSTISLTFTDTEPASHEPVVGTFRNDSITLEHLAGIDDIVFIKR